MLTEAGARGDDPIAFFQVLHICANLGDLSNSLAAGDAGESGGLIAINALHLVISMQSALEGNKFLVNTQCTYKVEVRRVNGGREDLKSHVVGSDLAHRYVLFVPTQTQRIHSSNGGKRKYFLDTAHTYFQGTQLIHKLTGHTQMSTQTYCHTSTKTRQRT
jgi:hypothetical protein